MAATNQLTEESSKEQKLAGLDRLSNTELKEFTNLNSKYTKKFKHPFIMAVSGKDKFDILKAFHNRIDNEPEKEIETANKEVEKIALIRIEQILNNSKDAKSWTQFQFRLYHWRKNNFLDLGTF